jgi:hypothetical protein
MSLAFLCHFNILSVHASLVNPTRERLRHIVHSSMGIGECLFVRCQKISCLIHSVHSSVGIGECVLK